MHTRAAAQKVVATARFIVDWYAGKPAVSRPSGDLKAALDQLEAALKEYDAR